MVNSARDALDAQTLHDSPGSDLDGRHPDDCPCQFCREDEQEERERMDRDDRDDRDDEGEDEADYEPVSPAFYAGPSHDPQWSAW